MKKQFIALGTLLIITSGLFALTDTEAQRKGNDLLEVMFNGHTAAFGKNTILKGALDLSVWNKAIADVKAFVTTVINENKNFFGVKDSTLVNALEKITKAEMDLVNSIKITRGVLNSPKSLEQQITLLNKIKSDMLDVQNSLKGVSSSPIKQEARKLLNRTAIFIETTAAKAAKEAYQAIPPKGLPPVFPG